MRRFYTWTTAAILAVALILLAVHAAGRIQERASAKASARQEKTENLFR